MKNCNWCDNQFKATVSYQVYCSTICREAATKQKIASRYLHARRQKRIGKKRLCKNCQLELSIYNDEPICFECNVNPSDVKKVLKEIKRMAKE